MKMKAGRRREMKNATRASEVNVRPWSDQADDAGIFTNLHEIFVLERELIYKIYTGVTSTLLFPFKAKKIPPPCNNSSASSR